MNCDHGPESKYTSCCECLWNAEKRALTAEAVVEAFEAYRDAADRDPDVLPITSPGTIPLPPSTKLWRELMDRMREYRKLRAS